MGGEKKISERGAEWHPEPAESFESDYLNSRRAEISEGMLAMGFRITGSGQSPEGLVNFHGVSTSGDGTEVDVFFKKGAGNKSPKGIRGLGAEEKKEKRFNN